MFFYASGSQLGTGLPSKIIPQSLSGEDTATGTLNIDLYTLRLGQDAPSLVLSRCSPLALGAAATAAGVQENLLACPAPLCPLFQGLETVYRTFEAWDVNCKRCCDSGYLAVSSWMVGGGLYLWSKLTRRAISQTEKVCRCWRAKSRLLGEKGVNSSWHLHLFQAILS